MIAVPIVGLPFDVKAWHLTLVVQCKCPAREPVTLVGIPGAMGGECPACHNVFVVDSMTLDRQNATQFDIRVGRKQPG